MGIGTAQHLAPQSAGPVMICGIAQSAADLFRAFHSRQRPADNFTFHLKILFSRVPIVPIVPVIPTALTAGTLGTTGTSETHFVFYSNPNSAQRLRTFCVSSLLT